VFNSSKNRTNFEALPLFIMDVTNGSVKQIADQGWKPVWSRDGKKIAYTKDPRCGGYCSGFDIHILDLETGVEKNVWETSTAEDYVCDWGLNGQSLLISSFAITDTTIEDDELYFLNLEDGSLLRLTDNEVEDSGARLSPDGSKIVYSSFTGTDWDLFVMDADGSNKRNLTNDDKVFNSFPAWSPDGNKIIFSASDGPGVGGSLDIVNIYVINIDGTGLQKLTNGSVKGDINDAPDWRWK
jgi:Tol biopolymer transport system component